MTAYCGSCRQEFEVDWAPPPYSVLHVSQDEHRHPVTRTLVQPVVRETE